MNTPPRRKKNAELRTREYLTPKEVETLRKAAKGLGRHGDRDALMIRMAYIHGFRASELLRLEWSDIDFDLRTVHVRRLKGSISCTHQLTSDEIRGLKRLKGIKRGYIFESERGGSITTSGFGKIVARAGEAAKFDFSVHPHMLRHATGYKLANEGKDTRSIQEYLGHKNIQNTVRYTALSSERFKGFWVD